MLEFNEKPASSIPPGRDPADITYEDVQYVLQNYIKNIDYDHVEQHMLNNGSAKQPPSKLNITSLIQGLNMLIYDFIKTNGEPTDSKQSNIIKSYFEGVNKLSVVMNNVDVKVAETKMLCYIIGYLLKLINNFKQSEE